MKRSAIKVLVFCLFTALLGAQEVAEDEFLGSSTIEFTHFTGEYSQIDTLEDIKGIGRFLASGLDIYDSGKAETPYFQLIHSYQPEIPEGLDGDILILLPNSRVDHVKNLRHIIAGFLTDLYKYEYERAYLLAEFITYYNAVHYQEIDYFQSRFKSGVMASLTPQASGLSTVYSEWPGKARIVIPLRNPNQEGLSSVDTSVITEKEVIEQMQQEEDQNLDERKDIVELREEENKQEEQAIQEEKDQITEEKNQLEEELQNLENKEDLTQEEQNTKEELQDQIAEKDEELQQVEDKQAELDKRTEEVLDMRDDIAQDENKQIQDGTDEKGPSEEESVFTSAAEDKPVPMHFFHYEGSEEGIPFGKISLYDLTSSSKTKDSTVTTLYGREYQEFDSNFLAVGKNRSSSEIHLMLIDRDELALLLESTEVFYPGSRIEIDQSNKIYGVINSDGKWFLARFGKNLQLETRSTQEVDPMTDILFYNGKIFVQMTNGDVSELNFQTLSPEKEYR